MKAPHSRPTFIIGAGFSKAASDSMPLIDELGHLAYGTLRTQGVHPPKWPSVANFEAWLSRMAEDQPDLDHAENLSNRSLFVRASEAIADVMAQRQGEIKGAPDWLFRLVTVLHCVRATVITFNYDNLIEQVVDVHQLWDMDAGGRVQSPNVLDHLPPFAPAAATTETRRDTFRLLKLHGSLNWWWSEGDTTGATVNRWHTPQFGQDDGPTNEERHRHLPGRSRFIVPPTATKSTYYTNPLTRELWREAALAINQANELFVVGYSLPLTDIVASGMLRDRIPPTIPVTVVDCNPAPVVERLIALGVSGDNINVLSGKNAVASLADRLEQRQARRLVTRLQTSTTHYLAYRDRPVAVAWGEGLFAPVVAANVDDDELRLTVEPPDTDDRALRARATSRARLVTEKNILTMLRPPDGDEDIAGVYLPDVLTAVFPDGQHCRMVDVGSTRRTYGAAGEWLTFVPAIGPPSEEDNEGAR